MRGLQTAERQQIMNGKYYFDLHVHTDMSFDCNTRIDEIIREVKLKAIDGIAITDHSRIFSPERAKKLSIQHRVNIISGEEINTNQGEIIGLFMQEQLADSDFYDVIDRLRDQDALIILPHPYRGHSMIEILANNVDGIEVLNAKSHISDNIAAHMLSKKFSKGRTGGSDAHTADAVGACLTIFEECDEESIRRAILRDLAVVSGYFSSIKATTLWGIRKLRGMR